MSEFFVLFLVVLGVFYTFFLVLLAGSGQV